MIKIRSEKLEDINSIRQVNLAAFEQSNEAALVDKLRSNCKDFISFVAEEDNQLVGYIFFTPVKVETKKGIVEGMGLAPMAVLPEYQKKGIGAKLIEKGVEELKNRGCPFVVVLGHAEYYPKFGFEVASKYGIRCKWEVPDEAFMVKILDGSSTASLKGKVKYHSEFDKME